MSADIAVLFAARKSNYKQIRGLDIYDKDRDARTYTGNSRVIAHPPCRSYSAYLWHQAKPETGERDLALFAIERIINNGGILEHPAHSKLFRIYDLPKPGESFGGLKTIAVRQDWWGFGVPKKTWLLMSDWIEPEPFPFKLMPPQSGPYGIIENMSSFQRAETTLDFAMWLINSVRNS